MEVSELSRQIADGIFLAMWRIGLFAMFVVLVMWLYWFAPDLVRYWRKQWGKWIARHKRGLVILVGFLLAPLVLIPVVGQLIALLYVLFVLTKRQKRQAALGQQSSSYAPLPE